MTESKKQEIIDMSKDFSEGLGIEINGSSWLIVDPLSGYLNAIGYENKLQSIDANDLHPQVLIIIFEDGTKFIPAGADLIPLHPSFTNYMFI